MNNQEFIKELASRLNLTHQDADDYLKGAVKVLKEVFGQQDALTFQNFGTFNSRKIESRKGYSPILKDYVIFPPKRILEFHPSDALREKVKNTNPS